MVTPPTEAVAATPSIWTLFTNIKVGVPTAVVVQILLQ